MLRDRMRENYQSHSNQGGGANRNSGKYSGPGGMSLSNETSMGNPLGRYNPDYLDHFKRQNEQLVANDPYKSRG